MRTEPAKVLRAVLLAALLCPLLAAAAPGAQAQPGARPWLDATRVD